MDRLADSDSVRISRRFGDGIPRAFPNDSARGKGMQTPRLCRLPLTTPLRNASERQLERRVMPLEPNSAGLRGAAVMRCNAMHRG
eukprot:8324667-Pyramimonas_sp.AAC.2